MNLPRRAWVRLNRIRTGVGRFRSCLYKWGMASSAACECGAEEQTVDHVVLQCPIHRPPHGLHGLTVLDVETTEWLLNTCPEIYCGQAVDKKRTRSNEEANVRAWQSSEMQSATRGDECWRLKIKSNLVEPTASSIAWPVSCCTWVVLMDGRTFLRFVI